MLDGDPLKDLRNTNTIRYVMKNGELYEGNTLDQIWPKQKKLELKWMGGGDPIDATELPPPPSPADPKRKGSGR